jgi:hypothetical protein
VDQRIRRAAYSSLPRFRTYVEIIGQGIGRPIRHQPDGRQEAPDSVTRGLWIHKRSSVVFHAVLVLSKAILARCTFARMSCAVLVHPKGVRWAWRWVMYVSIAAISSGTLRKTPRRICLAVRSPKTRSPKLSHELLVGVKCMCLRGWRLKHRWTVGCVCVASLSAIRCRALSLGTWRSIRRRNVRHSWCRIHHLMTKRRMSSTSITCPHCRKQHRQTTAGLHL